MGSPQTHSPFRPLDTQALAEDEARAAFVGVAAALRHMHETAGLVHRDVKLENVLLAKVRSWGMRAADTRRRVRCRRAASMTRNRDRGKPSPRLHPARSQSGSLDSVRLADFGFSVRVSGFGALRGAHRAPPEVGLKARHSCASPRCPSSLLKVL